MYERTKIIKLNFSKTETKDILRFERYLHDKNEIIEKPKLFNSHSNLPRTPVIVTIGYKFVKG